MPNNPKKPRSSKRKSRENQLWINKLGSRIRDLRDERNLTQKDVGDPIDIDAKALSRIERGIVTPSAFVVKQICRALGVSLAEFYEPLED